MGPLEQFIRFLAWWENSTAWPVQSLKTVRHKGGWLINLGIMQKAILCMGRVCVKWPVGLVRGRTIEKSGLTLPAQQTVQSLE